MEEYFLYSPTQISYGESHILEMLIITGIVVTLFVYFMTKPSPGNIARPRSRELPEGWYGRLANLIMIHAQKKDGIDNVSEFFTWKHNGYKLELCLSWQDFYDDINIDTFDLPVLLSASIILSRRGLINTKIFMMAYLDRSNPTFSSENYIERYNERKNNAVDLMVRGKRVAL